MVSSLSGGMFEGSSLLFLCGKEFLFLGLKRFIDLIGLSMVSLVKVG